MDKNNPKNGPKERKYGMYEAILQLKDLDECCRFFDDLCAMTELRSMEQRYEVAKMLSEGKVYTDIMEKSSASSATISRVKRALHYGTGCLGDVIERMKQSETEE